MKIECPIDDKRKYLQVLVKCVEDFKRFTLPIKYLKEDRSFYLKK